MALREDGAFDAGGEFARASEDFQSAQVVLFGFGVEVAFDRAQDENYKEYEKQVARIARRGRKRWLGQLLAQAAGELRLIEHENAKLTRQQVGSSLAVWFQFQPLYARITKERPDLFE